MASAAAGRVITGYSYPMFVTRGGQATSADEIARGVDMSLTVETNDETVTFYANNGKAETVSTGGEFVSGEISLTVDGLLDGIIKKIFNVTSDIPSGATEANGYMYKSNTKPNEVAYGCVVRTISGNNTQYYYIVLPRVKFDFPEDAAATQEDTIDFQTTTLEGSFFEETDSTSTYYQCWKYLSKEYDSETACKDALDTFLVTNFA